MPSTWLKTVIPNSSEYKTEPSFVGNVDLRCWRQRSFPDFGSGFFRFFSGLEKLRVRVSLPFPMVGDFNVIVVSVVVVDDDA